MGLYLNPPEHALVLCCDEKSQIQALDRTQPGLPLKRGRGTTMTHDYKRNGTATLFAALNAATGKVISLCQERHRRQEWLKFLRLVDDATPAGKQLHIIADNYATHKQPNVQRWLARHPAVRNESTPHVTRDHSSIRTRDAVLRGGLARFCSLRSATSKSAGRSTGLRPFRNTCTDRHV